MPNEFAVILARARNMRQKSDYEVFTHFEKGEVEELIANAKTFVEKVRGLV
jgi:uncharacterized protein (UPF0332 family)